MTPTGVSTLTSRTVRLVLALTLVASAPVAAQDAESAGAPRITCSRATLQGRYAATISGWFGTGPTRLPYGATGSIRLDGRGHITGAGVQTLDGVISEIAITGTYTVNPRSCTGNATSTIGTFFFAITENGEGTRIVGTTPGTTVTGHAVRQH